MSSVYCLKHAVLKKRCAWQKPFVKQCVSIDSYGKRDRKSTRLNSSHLVISYAVFCLKKKKTRKFCPGITAKASLLQRWQWHKSSGRVIRHTEFGIVTLFDSVSFHTRRCRD